MRKLIRESRECDHPFKHFVVNASRDVFNFVKKAATFVKETLQVAAKKVVKFIKGVWDHIETVAILVLATFGLAVLIGELPFLLTLPIWIEAPMVAPVIAIILMKLLTWFSQWRYIHQHPPLKLVA